MEQDLFAQAQRIATALRRLPGLRAVVLYGSVARGEERPGSDIDLFIILSQKGQEQRVKETVYAHAAHATSLTLPVTEASKRLTLRDFFWRDIIEQGVILHDDGTYTRLRQKALGKGRAVPVRR
ncbi:MAG: nucleotidyltransferase domain-containing protein [Candidatus Aenigmarchaeota archaeon]|nr:nucleotidyltransferase domain-containing protein [Candidatus Aenigmarchaeota archaeon]